MAHHTHHEDSLGSFLLGFLLALVGGAVAGVLLAPKKGDDFRRDVWANLRALPGQLKEDMQNPDGKTRQFFDRTRYGLENKIEQVSDSLQALKLAKAKRREEQALPGNGGFEAN